MTKIPGKMGRRIGFASQFERLHYTPAAFITVNCGEAQLHDRDHELEQSFSSHFHEVERDRRELGTKHSFKGMPSVTFFINNAIP